MKLLAKVNAIFDRITSTFALLAILLLAFVMLSVGTGVVMRYFVRQPLQWVTEMTEYCLVWITFLGTAWLLKKERHVTMDIVLSRLESRTQNTINIITSIIGIAICLILTWYGGKVTLDLFLRGHTQPTVLRTLSFPLFTIIPAGSFLLLVQFVRRTYAYLKYRGPLPHKE